MSKFALKEIDAINGKQTFDKLFINNSCQFDEFEEIVQEKQNYRSELGTIYRYMEYLANGNTLPEKHFKDITPKNQSVKEYEFRSKHLRVYAIKKENGKIIILGGFKSNQPFDLNKFRKIKKEYLGSLKP
jgi:hypothetical protein